MIEAWKDGIVVVLCFVGVVAVVSALGFAYSELLTKKAQDIVTCILVATFILVLLPLWLGSFSR